MLDNSCFHGFWLHFSSWLHQTQPSHTQFCPCIFMRLSHPPACGWTLKRAAQLCAILLLPHRLQPTRLLGPRNFPGKNTGVGCYFLLQVIFPTQGLNTSLLHCRRINNVNSSNAGTWGGFSIVCIFFHFFINIVQFSVYKFLTSLVKFIPKHFILVIATVIGNAFIIPLSEISLFVYH